NPEDLKIRRKQLPTKVLAGNQNPWENNNFLVVNIG
ncbi:hypothetical protein A2U01_0096676, partial [Trifolium medium]|nr:hypothetical protein [Trifolium medium]